MPVPTRLVLAYATQWALPGREPLPQHHLQISEGLQGYEIEGGSGGLDSACRWARQGRARNPGSQSQRARQGPDGWMLSIRVKWSAKEYLCDLLQTLSVGAFPTMLFFDEKSCMNNGFVYSTNALETDWLAVFHLNTHLAGGQ